MKHILPLLCLCALGITAISAPPEQANNDRKQQRELRQKTINRKAELKARAEFMAATEDLDDVKQAAALTFLRTNVPNRSISSNDTATFEKQVRAAGTNYTAAQWQAATEFVRTNQ